MGNPSGVEPSASGDGPSFAERLRVLFDNVHPRGRGPFSQAEVVDMIRASGGSVTIEHLSQLLSGDQRTPALSTVTDIAAVFRVPMDYFGSRESYEEIRRHIGWLAALRDSGAERVTVCSRSGPVNHAQTLVTARPER
ncbi:helix-turn-helix transcriptional regulator [Nocardia terpenica]|uniref:Uncharacterized protein n=1 Tax=Nocardia terpenica TaxID=455432 RepID=A0A164IV34_9NOCA|nr:helix-turn-helix transcriptional regulator [Nocardia terpenica]KZM69772.1 hypothetical protein AWN90_07045 [Nocardia terpenica]NQE89447.1 helix-turn-helix transcriptional regulator [Nocardia terpenica]